MPTQIQQQVPHFGWVDLFPSPQLRDNLILAFEKLNIDEDEFIIELVGEAFGSLCCAGDSVDELETQPGLDVVANSSSSITETEEPTNVTANTAGSCTGGPGLVSWSDPWDIAGWEVAEPFAKKWGFLLQGCRDVVAAANSWRELRGEDPLAITV
ncbi:hypothetical protein QQX98_010318 [Neonectria punicea]|uniref:Uncharacterized protein n=1 Tax=Neonectria punicea TaxID=979145 RepID=A0ABR1GPW0_9HYPO